MQLAGQKRKKQVGTYLAKKIFSEIFEKTYMYQIKVEVPAYQDGGTFGLKLRLNCEKTTKI